MIFFVTSAFPTRKTGIESAMISRLNLLRAHNYAAVIVTLVYNPSEKFRYDTFGVPNNQHLNLYDYLLGFSTDRTLFNDDTGKKVSRLQNGKTYSIKKFDEQKRLRERLIYNQAGQRQLWEIFDSTGKRRLIYHYEIQDEKAKVSAIVYYDDENHLLNFSNLTELKAYFLTQLNNCYDTGGDNIFIADRVGDVGAVLERIKTHHRKFIQIHSKHTNDVNEPITGRIQPVYQYVLNNVSHWTGIIASTKQQAAELEERFPKTPVFRIPVGIVEPISLQKDSGTTRRIPGKLITVARIDSGKNIAETIQIVSELVKLLPNITLDIWGLVADEKYKKQLERVIADLELTQVIKFKGYTNDLARVYQTAQLLISTSRYEGTGLTILESMANQTPVFTNGFKYGTDEFLEDGVNGIVGKRAEPSANAKRIFELIKNETKWQKMSEYAGKTAQKFNPDFAYHCFKQLLDQNDYRGNQND